ncbi:MAG: hypothetical protein QXL17_04475 [Candidatus Thermoplasmatota archaeon]
MDIIPCICIKHAKCYSLFSQELPLSRIHTILPQESILYLYDVHGIAENRPDLTMMQRLADEYIVWVDAGVRSVDDVMDVVTAGASKITLRKNLWQTLEIPKIRYVTDVELYLDISSGNFRSWIELSVYADMLGFTYVDIDHHTDEQYYENTIKELSTKYKIYLLKTTVNSVHHWKEYPIAGFIVDITKYQEFKNLCSTKQE